MGSQRDARGRRELGGPEGSWEPASALVVVGRHDVSAVLCGPGEWRETGRETGPGAEATRASLGAGPSSAAESGVGDPAPPG